MGYIGWIMLRIKRLLFCTLLGFGEAGAWNNVGGPHGWRQEGTNIPGLTELLWERSRSPVWAEKAADGAGCEPSSINCSCTLAAGWRDQGQLRVSEMPGRPAKPAETKPQLTAAACRPRLNPDTTQWAPANAHLWPISIPRGDAPTPLMYPATMRVVAGVDRAEML